ncbi:DUF4270 domain-containing protein [Capnocytophaga catalasegens]|uniref:DUF4270 domain-containing protein n=1 Tax=Capnocytophaga catalasegens TaxID=1004260 RepID=A0AAV5AVN4_9FLAO|nr:DUF4270 domain-containing protein [Capnocytophaga catalasegens]GIZ14487.1 hypothetical protein RCZ03_04880 [Capnocytophaga catalasegens]GJM50689.1 hypothetical protein RCZ15_16620 [Capnocytophaga catalasegens]GJM51842.1 hypothetical protein RCZ16_01600 [Capnocytophaga catalasegens]
MIKIYKKIVLPTAFILLWACNTDDDTKILESSILGAHNYSTQTTDIPIEIENIKVQNIQTNALNTYQLGQLTQGDFGTTLSSIVTQVSLSTLNPTFGKITQENEGKAEYYNEKETVESAYLYLPFYSTASQTTVNNEQVTTYKLDSIFGNKSATFNLNVSEIDYYLSDTDTNLGKKAYFSNQNIPTSTSLATNVSTSISSSQIIRYQFDDPTTTDDESKKERDRLAPGIRIAIDPAIFQTYLLDKEGDNVLNNNATFTQLLKGVMISPTNFSDDVLALINLANAKIEVVYTYVHKKDGQEYTQKGLYELNLLRVVTSQNATIQYSIAFNKYQVTNDNITTSTDNIYLKGGQGYVAEVTIPEANIQELKNKKALIIQADLIFYVDQNKQNLANIKKQPLYMVAYKANSGAVLEDFKTDVSYNNNVISSLATLKSDAGGKYYKLRITDHVTELIKGGKNVKIGVATSTNIISNSMNAKLYNDTNSTERYTVVGNAESPLCTILFGNSTNVNESVRFKLQVRYATPK